MAAHLQVAQHTPRLVVCRAGGGVRNPHDYQQRDFHAFAGGCDVAGNGITLLRYLHDGVRISRWDRQLDCSSTAARAFVACLVDPTDWAECSRFCARRVPHTTLGSEHDTRQATTYALYCLRNGCIF
jgi:hypothetical protein